MRHAFHIVHYIQRTVTELRNAAWNYVIMLKVWQGICFYSRFIVTLHHTNQLPITILMNRLLSLLVVLSIAVSSHGAAKSKSLVSYVDPLIGTAHCRSFHFAPGSMPFGMAKPGPSTNGSLGNADGWQATGYDYRDQSIEGFTCTHEFQIGGITLMPTVGNLITLPGNPDGTGEEGYRSPFTHDNEVAGAGYYKVLLSRYGVTAELTATERVALMRFTYPESRSSHLIFDIGHQMGESGKVKDAEVWINADGSIEGWVVTLPEYIRKYQPGADLRIYFSARVDKSAKSVGVFNGSKVRTGDRHTRGIGAGAYLDLDTRHGEEVTARVGISYTSVENARLNLDTEARSISFDKARALSSKAWENALGRIRVETSNADDMKKFYTGLYHALLGRGVCSDVNGAYPRHDGGIGYVPMVKGKPKFRMYNSDAMWGGQWNLTQLWALAYPEHLSEFISSHLQVFNDCGWLADGIANSRFVSGVGTNQLPLMIAAAYQCGIRDFDLDLAYRACIKNEFDGTDRPQGAGKDDTSDFVRLGYAPHKNLGEPGEDFCFSGSHTLEYSFSAWAVAQMAKSMGRMEHYDKLMWMSRGWERIYDSESGFMRPRTSDGRFIEHFDPMQVWRGFQEGNAWQYTFYVPHMPEELIDKVGNARFIARLDSIFTLSQPKIFSGGTEVGAFAGLRTLYNQGNQPCLHISWLFKYTDSPHLTDKWVRAICNEFYGTDGIHGYGYGQDEDQGQLGAWYVMSSVGLFDVRGLSAPEPKFSLGSTLFDKVTVSLNRKYYKGKSFVINAVGNSSESYRVAGYRLNGRDITSPFVSFDDVTGGGTLDVTMQQALSGKK